MSSKRDRVTLIFFLVHSKEDQG